MKPGYSLGCFRNLALAIGTAAFAVNTGSAALLLVDDFSSGNLDAYTQTRVLDNGIEEENVSFSAASGQLVAFYNGSLSQPEQVTLLRGDHTLAVGQRLLADVSQGTSSTQMDFGIMVATTATPTSVSGSTTDTRTGAQWAAVFVRPSTNQVRSQFYDGVISSINTNPASAVLSASPTTVASLWIQRDSATSFSMGYIDTSGSEFISRTVTTFTNDGVGNAIGFWADLRAPGATLGGLDNLRIIPEPTSAGLAGLSLLLPLLRRRR